MLVFSGIILCPIRSSLYFYNASPSYRYTYMQKEESDTFYFAEKLKTLIRKALVIPASTADAERYTYNFWHILNQFIGYIEPNNVFFQRAFSMLKHTRNARRAGLSPESLDSILRLNLNGPNDLSKFSPNIYTEVWIQKHMRIDDIIHEPKKKRIKLAPEPCLKEGEDGNGKESFPSNVLSGRSVLF